MFFWVGLPLQNTNKYNHTGRYCPLAPITKFKQILYIGVAYKFVHIRSDRQAGSVIETHCKRINNKFIDQYTRVKERKLRFLRSSNRVMTWCVTWFGSVVGFTIKQRNITF